MGPWHVRIASGSVGLEMNCQVRSSPDALIPLGAVADGLEGFCGLELREAIEEANPRMNSSSRSFVRVVELVAADGSQPRNLDLLFVGITIRGLLGLAPPVARGFRIPRLEETARVRNLAVLKEAGAVRCGSGACDIPAAGIRDETAKVRMLPHVRRSVNLESMSSSVSASFLREAAAIKGVESGAGELLAVFRNVPLAMISRVCFLEERGVLLYTTSSSAEPSRTRVHDIAAVRDRTTQKTHLVAHRTRYKTAFLH